MSVTRIGVCTLNQFAMDFEWNMKNIIESIKICKEKQVLYRLGPELEICGYSCEDHFLEVDTVQHCWEVLSILLEYTQGIICDIGMPVIHKNVFYNCRVICFDKKIYLIRPKQFLADDGNYRESRWFTPWSKEIEDFELPEEIQKICNQVTAPIGVAIVKTKDTEIGYEICEELWVPQPTSTGQALDGAEIIVNASGSYFQCGKIIQRTELFKDVTKRNGACYLFSNMRGCDGNRLYFDGMSMIAQNGKIFATSDAFSLHDVEVTTCDIDLEEVRVHNINFKSRSLQASKQKHFPRVKIPINLTQQYDYAYYKDIPINYPYEMEEATACFLWDYLRRSGASGFMLPLSGGLDSCASAISVFHMCQKVFTTINTKDPYQTHQKVLDTLRKIVSDPEFMPKSPQEIMSRIFFTVYLGTENSSKETRRRSAELSKALGTTHFEVDIDDICASFSKAIKPVLKQEPKFSVFGGSQAEDLALQNIQARTRMVMTYFMAQLAPWNNGKQGFLLVLGSSNLDEGLRGYLTKYDCSSADINPIGSFTKNDLRKFVSDAYTLFKFEILKEILEAKPSAELKPLTNEKQVSEVDMGLSFDELETFGKLRKSKKLGPVSMFKKLRNIWTNLSNVEIAEKVKKFFTFYSINRHKCVTLTASFHALDHSCDDNRYDFRQIFYNIRWPWQYKKIDEQVELHKKKK